MNFKDIKNMADGIANNIVKNSQIEEIYNKRKAICDTCTHLNKEGGTCKLCGCFLEIKLRARYAHCPAYKWLAEPETDNVK